jgi:hypothetical protein
MKSLFSACGGALLAAALATPAAAQVAGVYTGTAADGSGITFTVSTDPNNNDLALTSAGIGFSAPCKNSTYVFNNGWGFGLTADIVNRKVTYQAIDNYFVFDFSLTFASDGQTATGTITSYSPTLTALTDKPTKALFCVSPKQTLSLTLQPPTVRVNPGTKGPQQFNPLRRQVSQILR